MTPAAMDFTIMEFRTLLRYQNDNSSVQTLNKAVTMYVFHNIILCKITVCCSSFVKIYFKRPLECLFYISILFSSAQQSLLHRHYLCYLWHINLYLTHCYYGLSLLLRHYTSLQACLLFKELTVFKFVRPVAHTARAPSLCSMK